MVLQNAAPSSIAPPGMRTRGKESVVQVYLSPVSGAPALKLTPSEQVRHGQPLRED
jgi:hypothetical protein